MKKLTVSIAILISLLITLSLISSALQNGYDLFQKALAKERGEGNLEEAIALYKKVIAETKDESLAAKAQFRIGICYEKLGQEKAKLAQAAFQKVISEYPGQRDIVKMAQEKLSNFIRAQAALEKGDKEFQVRQVWTGKEVDGSGEVSFDGKYLSFVDWETGDLAIREMTTGKKRHLTHNDQEKSHAYAMNSVSSPDGKQLAYIWEKYAKGQVEVHIVGLDGSEPRLLHQVDSHKGWVELADWSPDGKNILAFFSNETRQRQLGLISIKDSSIQILKALDAVDPLPKAQFSPDGRYIVYDFPQERESGKKDISIISLDGMKEIPLIAHPADDYLLGWSPDGKWILFSSDRAGTRDAWIIQVLEGKPQGDPQLVKRDIGLIGSLGFSQDGSFYYGTEGAMYAGYDIYSAKLDPETGSIIEQPKKDPLPYEGHNIYPDWSPDGKNLVYISRRGPGRRQPILCLYSVESGRVREFDLKEKFIHFSYPRWCPDGRFILLLAEDFQSGKGIYKIDAQTGEANLLIRKKEKESSDALWWPVMSLDGKLLFYIHENMSDKYYPLVVRDLETGKEEELLRNLPYDRNTIAISPDGQRLALLLREEEKLRVLKVMSIKGGEPLELHRFEQGWRDFIDIDWSPDGRYIYFSKQKPSSEGGKWELWRVPAKGGKAENLGSTMMPYFIYLSVHPDGEWITFASVHSMRPEIWVMENFLPEDKKEGKGGQK